MSTRGKDEPLDVSPDRQLSMPVAAFVTVLVTCCGATFWASQVYRDISGLKETAVEMNLRLIRIERRVGVLPTDALTLLSPPTRPPTPVLGALSSQTQLR